MSVRAERNRDKNDVVMKRFVEGQWTELSTTYLEETDTHYKFEASVPGFSYFAVALKEEEKADVSVSGLDVSPAEGETPLDVTVTAQVTNQGDAAGDKEVEIYLDGKVLTTETVSLAAGETTEVEHSFSLSGVGQHTIRVGDFEETITVNEAEAGPEEPGEGPGEGPEEKPKKKMPSWALYGLVAAVVVVLLVYLFFQTKE